MLRAAAGRAHAAQADELAAVFRSTSPLLKPTRDALAAARKSLADLQIPSTLVMKERAFVRAALVRAARARKLRGQGRARLRRHARHAASASQRPAGRTGSGSRAGWSTRATRWSPASPSIGSGSRSSAADWSRPARTSARRARRRRTRSCSTGSPPSSSQTAGARKSLIRTIVLSATYRQSSAVTPALAERDPYNRLFARGPRVRMEAEMIRDVALAAERPAQREDVRPERLPAAARRHLEHARTTPTSGRRALARIAIAAACTRSGGARRPIRAS